MSATTQVANELGKFIELTGFVDSDAYGGADFVDFNGDLCVIVEGPHAAHVPWSDVLLMDPAKLPQHALYFTLPEEDRERIALFARDNVRKARLRAEIAKIADDDPEYLAKLDRACDVARAAAGLGEVSA